MCAAATVKCKAGNKPGGAVMLTVTRRGREPRKDEGVVRRGRRKALKKRRCASDPSQLQPHAYLPLTVKPRRCASDWILTPLQHVRRRRIRRWLHSKGGLCHARSGNCPEIRPRRPLVRTGKGRRWFVRLSSLRD